MEEMARLKMLFETLDADESIKKRAIENIEKWLTDAQLAPYRPYIQHQIETEQAEGLLDAFWRMMPFGTGGRRGPVGAGPNRINPYTIALSVEGHCRYLKQLFGDTAALSVVVAFDVREYFDLRGRYTGISGVLEHMTSRDLAQICAETYAGNGIKVHVVGPLSAEGDVPVSQRFISTPELSFLIRELKAQGGLNISASHNHPDDNGGKFYNDDGGQEIPPNDEKLLNIVETVKNIQFMPYADARRQGLIEFVPKELHDRYIEVNQQLSPTDSRSASVAFTPLCGTGTTTVLEALNGLGYPVKTVAEQCEPDGSFQSVKYRIGNPEVPEAMDRLKAVALESGCDVGFATDPDADRLGILVPSGDGDMVHLNGNEIGVLLIESILQSKKRNGTLTKTPLFINTVVTSSLQREIAKRYGCQVVGDLMVGFKYMGDVLRNIEAYGRFPKSPTPNRDSVAASLDDFVFTTEEAHGYLLTHRVRDKDACGAAVHLAGLASRLKDENKTILGLLNDIYRVYGYTTNHLRSLVMEGIVGLERIGRIQKVLRENPPKQIANRTVLKFIDYHTAFGPLVSSTDEASRNVLLFELDNGDERPIRLIVRPSGTEPKTKIYVEVAAQSPLKGTLFDATSEALSEIDDAMLAETREQTDKVAVDIADWFINYCLGEQVLKDAYPDIPAGCLTVSDLVPIDQKIRVFKDVLPALEADLRKGRGVDEMRPWLLESLTPLGEDPLGLIKSAVETWILATIPSEDSGLIGQLRSLLLSV